MIVLFWTSVAALVLVYAGYPVLLWAWTRARRRPVRAAAIEPVVSIVIAAHNEAGAIAATIENKLALDYPADRREVLVVSDGSTDETEAIVRGYADRGVRLIEQRPRQGKTAGLNRAVVEAKGEIVVFSDANSIYDRGALRALVSNFADPSVGYATGKMVYVDETGSLVGSGCSAYMRYENVLRSLETAAGSVVGVDGGVDAVRRSLYVPMRADLLPDLVLPLEVVAAGRRVVYDPRALLKEAALTDASDETRMRVRVALRSFHALWHMRRLFNPMRSGVFAFQLAVHKLLRYWAGFIQLVAFAANASLLGAGLFYQLAFAAQVGFYAAAALGGWRASRSAGGGWAGYAYYLCLLNGTAVVAFWKFLRGERQVVWQPRKG